MIPSCLGTWEVEEFEGPSQARQPQAAAAFGFGGCPFNRGSDSNGGTGGAVGVGQLLPQGPNVTGIMTVEWVHGPTSP